MEYILEEQWKIIKKSPYEKGQEKNIHKQYTTEKISDKGGKND
jgi:hypothetical protein